MENAVVQLSKLEWGIKLKSDGDEKKDDDKDKPADDYSSLHRYESRQRDEVAEIIEDH